MHPPSSLLVSFLERSCNVCSRTRNIPRMFPLLIHVIRRTHTHTHVNIQTILLARSANHRRTLLVHSLENALTKETLKYMHMYTATHTHTHTQKMFCKENLLLLQTIVIYQSSRAATRCQINIPVKHNENVKAHSQCRSQAPRTKLHARLCPSSLCAVGSQAVS